MSQASNTIAAQAGSFDRIQDLPATLTVVGIELGVVAAVGLVLYLVWTRAMRWFQRGAYDRAPRRRPRALLIGASSLAALAILGYNGWLIARGIHVPTHTAATLAAIGADMGAALGILIAKVVSAAIGVWIAARLLGHALGRAEAAINRWDRLRDNDRSLAYLFAGLHRVIVNAGWLLVALYALRLFAVPGAIVGGLLVVLRAYLVIAIGVLVIRSSVVIVDTLDAFGRGYAETRNGLRYYEYLRPLLPTFRACLEYALWVALASLALLQLGPAGSLAAWGPRVIQAIGIFFLGRVVVELGRAEIARRLLPREGLDETARRRRATIAPLVRSSLTYAVFFATAVLILASLGFNPVPFLAGAGILGLVIGFGAQSLINDVVSGFFILFENTYLVGDAVEAGGARGVVEAIEFRTTKVRDAEGRLHIIRNGDVKTVVNYSKDYALAVVPVDVIYEADLRSVFSILREAGRRLRAENPDVLADTQIDGIVAFGESTMTVRTSTRVKPGRHEAMAAALRFAIKEAFDRRGAGQPRRGLVPVGLATGPQMT